MCAFTNFGAQAAIWRIGSPLNDLWIHQVGVGSGSGTSSVTNVVLLSETDRNTITGSPDFSTVRKVGFQGDFNSVEMSGTHLTEFGLFTTGLAAETGSTWLREAFGSIVFDGTNELQIVVNLEALPG